MLGEFAFDTGHPFDETLIADEQALVREAVQDYWRQQCYPLEGPALESLLAQYPTPDAMFADVSRLLPEKRAWPPPMESLAECVERATREHANALAVLSTGWAVRAQSMRDWIELQIDRHPDHWTSKAFRRADFKRWFDDISRWAHDPVGATPLKSETARLRLSPADLLSRRAPGAPPLALPDSFAALAQLLDAIERLSRPHTAIRIHAAASVAARLKALKTQSRTFGFSDIVERLAQALEGDHAGALRRAVLARYPVALIDEFQDTSPAQYRLFDALYRCADNDSQHALFLIGDPKQSIYQFRGADIHSYLRARAATAGRHYALDTNYRSTRALVDAVNSWFLRAEERRVSAADAWSGAFLFGSPNGQPIPFQPTAARGRHHPGTRLHSPLARIESSPVCRALRRAHRHLAQRFVGRFSGSRPRMDTPAIAPHCGAGANRPRGRGGPARTEAPQHRIGVSVRGRFGFRHRRSQRPAPLAARSRRPHRSDAGSGGARHAHGRAQPCRA
jgi:exodeoxyribonuclease V beta subunit